MTKQEAQKYVGKYVLVYTKESDPSVAWYLAGPYKLLSVPDYGMVCLAGRANAELNLVEPYFGARLLKNKEDWEALKAERSFTHCVPSRFPCMCFFDSVNSTRMTSVYTFVYWHDVEALAEYMSTVGEQ